MKLDQTPSLELQVEINLFKKLGDECDLVMEFKFRPQVFAWNGYVFLSRWQLLSILTPRSLTWKNPSCSRRLALNTV